MAAPSETKGFVHQVLKLATGAAVAQVAPLLAMPALTRLYSPAAFGEFGVASTLLLGLSIVASGRYEIAIPLPTSRQTSFHLVVLSLLIAFAVSVAIGVIVAAILVIGGGRMPDVLQMGVTAAALLPVGILFSALMQSCSYWLTRQGHFGAVARARSIHGLLTAGAGVALGVLGVRSGLLYSLAAAYVVAGAGLAAHVWKSDGHRMGSVTASDLQAVLKEYRHFPVLNGGNAVLDLVRESGTLIVFGALFGQAATGFLSQALRIMKAPVTLVGQSVAQVYFPAASRIHAAGDSVRALTARAMKSLVLFSVPLYLIVLIGGPGLFGFLLGEEWAVAGTYAQILSPWFMLVLVVSSLSLLPVACEAQGTALGFNVLESTVRLGALVAGGRLGGATGALIGVAVGGLATGGVQLSWYWRLSGRLRGHVKSAGGEAR